VVNGLQVTFEDEWPAATIAELASRGHQVMKLPEDYNAFGCAQIALRLDDGYLAAADPRRDSLPSGSDFRAGPPGSAFSIAFTSALRASRFAAGVVDRLILAHDALHRIERGLVDAAALVEQRRGDHDAQALHHGAVLITGVAETFSRYSE